MIAGWATSIGTGRDTLRTSGRLCGFPAATSTLAVSSSGAAAVQS